MEQLVRSISYAKARVVGVSSAKRYQYVATQVGYPELAIAADSDRAHGVAAYLWEQEVGIPKVAGELRTIGEIAQFQYYGIIQVTAKTKTLVTGNDYPVQYEPISINGPGGIMDSMSDIEISMKGARDAQNGEFILPE